MSRINSPTLRNLIDALDPNRRRLSRLKCLLRKASYQKLGLPFIDSFTFEKLLSHVIGLQVPFCCGKIGGTEAYVCQSIIQSWGNLSSDIPIRARKDSLVNSGINPNNYVGLSEFARLYIESIGKADVVHAWFQAGELETIHSAICSVPPFLAPLTSLEPYYGHSEFPWTHSLKDKKVVVISPFAETISLQFNKRLDIWPSGLLPHFSLSVLKFPHSPLTDSSISPKYPNRISYFKDRIAELDFDVLLAGCGAAAFPLAAYAKQLNRVGIAMGGSLQILFGIRGHRWDNDPFFNSLYNSHWVRPLPSEVPAHALMVENSAYW